MVLGSLRRRQDFRNDAWDDAVVKLFPKLAIVLAERAKAATIVNLQYSRQEQVDVHEHAAADKGVVRDFGEVNPLVDGVDECLALVPWSPDDGRRRRTCPWGGKACLVCRILEFLKQPFREPRRMRVGGV